MKISSLKFNKRNPRKISEKNKINLKKSLQKFGDLGCIVSNQSTGNLISGHQRISCLPADATIKIEQKYKKPNSVGTIAEGYIEINGERFKYREVKWDEEMEVEAMLAANNQGGENDDELLRVVLKDFPKLDLDLAGIELPEIKVIAPVEGEDDVPEVKESICKMGDLWILGNHRLLCGDSTNVLDVERLMNGEIAELCFTSPPYSDQREYNGGKELSTEHLAKFISTAYGKSNYFAVNLGYSRKKGSVNAYWDDYIKEAHACGLRLLSWNVWDKGHCGSIGNQNAMFGISHEWIFVFGNQIKELNRTVENSHFGERTNHSGNRQKDGTIKKSKEGKVRQFSQMKTIYSAPPQMARDDIDHPARFPIHFPESYINAMTDDSQLVYEPFGGSGSTLIACEKTNRKCFMMEIDPHYCTVIIERWQKYTGKKAELLGND